MSTAEHSQMASQVAVAERESETPAPEVFDTRAGWYRRLRRPWILVPVVVVVGLGVWFFAIRSDGSSDAAATTTTKQLVTVTRGALTNAVSAEGTVAAAQTDDLSFSAAGTVTAVNVKAGDTVTAGQVLATMDSASLQSAVASAASTLAKAQASLSDDEASGASSDQISADQTSVQSATDSLARAWQSLAGASLVATFDGTVSSVNLTVGEQLSSSGSGGHDAHGVGHRLRSVVFDARERQHRRVGRQQQLEFEHVVERADRGRQQGPVHRVAASQQHRRDVAQGRRLRDPHRDARVPAAAALAGSADSAAAARCRPSRAAAATVRPVGTAPTPATAGPAPAEPAPAATGNGSANTGATATGTVTAVGQVASASSGVAQYPVTVTFSTDNTQFSVGSTVTGAIQSVAADNVLQVPVRAITTDANGNTTVTVALDGKTNGRTATRTVQTGKSAGGVIEITSGLQEGDQVIVTTTIPAGLPTNGTGTRNTPGGAGQFPGLGTGGTGTNRNGTGAG